MFWAIQIETEKTQKILRYALYLTQQHLGVFTYVLVPQDGRYTRS